MDSFARCIQTETALQSLVSMATEKTRKNKGNKAYQNRSHTDTARIEKRQRYFPGRRGPLILVHVQPEHAREAEGEPAGKQGALLDWRLVCRHKIQGQGRQGNREQTIKLRRLLNTGIADAITHATTQRIRAIPTHDPTATKSLFCMRFVPAKIRMQIVLNATWPLTTPEMMIFMDQPQQTFCVLGGSIPWVKQCHRRLLIIEDRLSPRRVKQHYHRRNSR